MDNITHTLMGITMGRGIQQFQFKNRDSSRKRLQSAILVTSIVANNLPDIDFVTSFFAKNSKLHYLLQHRGYTHTMVGALLLTVLTALLIARLFRIPKDQWYTCIVTGLLGGLLHIFADSWNEYGVHPFWPFWNRWFYGDFIFIMEPLLIFSMLPLAIWSSESRWSKWLWIIVGSGILVATWITSLIPWPVAISITVFAAFLFYLQYYLKSHVGLATVTALSVWVLFLCASLLVRKDVLADMRDQGLLPSPLYQLVTAPAPGDPFCWRVLASGIGSDRLYHAQIGIVDLAPEFISSAHCYPRNVGENDHNAAISASPLKSTDGILWVGEYRGSLEKLHELETKRCEVRPLLRFLRVPYWLEQKNHFVLGDLRFDRGKNLSFAGFEFPYNSTEPECSVGEPPWGFPSGIK